MLVFLCLHFDEVMRVFFGQLSENALQVIV